MSEAIEEVDRQLLADHIAGNPEAFGELVSRYRDRLWAVALRTTGNPDEAADALQDALISAYTRADQYRGDAAVTTWLHRIVVNASLDQLRRQRIRKTVPLTAKSEDDIALMDAVPVGRGDSDDPLTVRETQLTVAQALARLSRSQREAILLVDVEGYSVEEAAEILQCPTGTVKSRCSRGRVNLADQLNFMRNQTGSSPVREKDGKE